MDGVHMLPATSCIPAGVDENASALWVRADIKLYVLVNPGRDGGNRLQVNKSVCIGPSREIGQ